MRALAALILCIALTGPALAQPRERAPRLTYAEQTVALARILGGAHYLRITCASRTDQRWRDAMRGLMQREPGQSGELTAAFNEGYRDEEARFPVCDQGARQTETELRAQGLRLSQALAARNAAVRTRSKR